MSPRAPSGSSHPPNNSGCVALNPHPADEAQRLRDFPGLTPKRVLPPPPHGVSEGPEEAGRERGWRPGGAPLPHQPRLLALGQALCPELPAPLRQSACGPQSEGPQRCPHPGSLEPVSALPHKAKGTAGSEPTQAPACLPAWSGEPLERSPRPLPGAQGGVGGGHRAAPAQPGTGGWGGTCLLRSSRSCLRPLSAPLCRGSYWGPAWGQDWVLRHLPPWASHLGMHRGSVDTAPGVAGAKPGGPHTSCFRARCDPLGYR